MGIIPLMGAACRAEYVRGMPVTQGKLGQNIVSVLRDTGCSGVVIRRNLVSDDQLTGTNKYCVLVDGTVQHLPVAYIFIDSPYFVGSIEALCMPNPIYDVIVGNVPTAREPGKPDHNWRCQEAKGTKVQQVTQQEDTYLHVQAVQTRAQKAAVEKPLPALKVPSALPEVTTDELRQAQQDDPTLQR